MVSSPFKGDAIRDGLDSFANWLYGGYDEQKYKAFQFLYHIPVVSNYMDYLLDNRADKEYLERNGMDYTDIHDPRKLSATDSGANVYRSAVNFVSKNLEKLYG